MKTKQDEIIVEGIRTHNLKNISIKLKKNAINLLIGPSGSGKSSLAYDTIAQIGQQELLALGSIPAHEAEYRVASYYNVPPTIPVPQLNKNNNVRSTIGTYFNLNRPIILIYAGILKIGEELFTLNKEENVCECCHGLGVESRLNPNLIIDYSKPIRDIPFRCWNRHKDFFAQMIVHYCNELGINPDKTFGDISKQQRELLVQGESSSKYSVKYKVVNRMASRTTKYYGPFHEKRMLPSISIGAQYYSDYTCRVCEGRKYSNAIEQYKIFGVSFGDFMMMPFSEMMPILGKLTKLDLEPSLSFVLNRLIAFVGKCNELSLGHLYFHRAIPTLSGGELQRLKLVQLFNSQLSDMLVVMDEPLAGLSSHEQNLVYRNIISLATKHTLLIVDHSDVFLNDANTVYALGPGSGAKGGYLIDTKSYLKQESSNRPVVSTRGAKIASVVIHDDIHQFKGVEIKIAQNSLNLLYGKSGVGKTTLLRDYLPQRLFDYVYISQKPLVGNKNSSVATSLNIFDGVTKLYARHFKKDKKLFSNLTGSEGACPECGGAGYIEYTYGDGVCTKLMCKECKGTGFNKKIASYAIEGVSMFDLWRMTIEEFADFIKNKDKAIYNVCQDAISVSLSHLLLGQATSSLSGGENIRVKVLKNTHTTASVLGIDEPFKGLSCTEVSKLIVFFNHLVQLGKTLIIVDHSIIAKPFFPHRFELINSNQTIKSVSDVRK